MRYEFKRQDAFDFASKIGIRAWQQGGNLQFKKCPYCGKYTDDKNTFGISLTTGTFNCFRSSCGAKGTFYQLANDFDFPIRMEDGRYYEAPKKQYRKLATPSAPIEPKPPAIEYLSKRGISEDIARKYEITVQNEHDNILVFPFYDENSILQFIKYRKTDYDKAKDKAKEWCEEGCKAVLFGMKQCNLDNKTLIVTEGQMDSLSVAESGFENAVSVPTGAKGFTWTPHCWDFMQNFDTIIVFGDREKGTISLVDEFAKRWKNKIKHVREADYLDCKDANEILNKYGKEQIKKCIDNAVSLPVNRVIDLASVENVDVFTLDKLKTGIRQLDKTLYGGFPFGSLVIVSGKAGEGKSTLTSQILAYALDQGKTCFAYSGELPNYQFKAWFDMQLAGDRHTFQYQNSAYGDTQYGISETNRNLITDWYRGRFYLYDNTSLDSDDEKESLVKTVEEVVLRYGVQVVLVDNLMTAMDLELVDGDAYEKQTAFVKALTRIAIKYQILVFLVAHKRKNNFSMNDNDEIAGSSNITNLAMFVISYGKGETKRNNDELEPMTTQSERLLKLTKNRLFGRVNTQGWTLGYSEKSKRIYGSGDDVNYEFGWAKNMNEEDENPFN